MKESLVGEIHNFDVVCIPWYRVLESLGTPLTAKEEGVGDVPEDAQMGGSVS